MKKYIVFFAISLAIFLGHAFTTKHAIYGDGNGYYVTAWSLLHKYTFKSEIILEHLKNFKGKEYTFSRIFWDENKNPYSVGTSLFWIPSMVVTSIFSSSNLDLIHELGPGITGIILMLAGLFLIEKYLKNYYSPRTSLLTVITLYIGSNLFYYSSLEPALSHQPAFFLIALLLYLTHDLKEKSPNYFILGLLFGLVQITRIADTFLLIPIFFSLKLNLKKIILIGCGFALGMVPQIIAQYYYYGTVAKNFYVTEASNQWSFRIIHLFEYLFSYQKGMFIWSPVYLLGVFGLVRLKKYLILATFVFIWCLGSFWSEHSSMTAGFGQRLSFASVPYLAIGIAYCYEGFRPNKQLIYTSFFALCNIFLLYGFYFLKWKNLS